jgi:dTDP-4-amino-4,6-dideoxygalactose transaminase
VIEPIPQASPGRTYAGRQAEIDAAIRRVLDSGSYILGSEVRAFEAEFGAYLGVPEAIGVGNGTDALELALRALEIGSGDAVFTVSHTAVATIAAIEAAGATPVLVDIDPATFLMDVERLKATIRSSADWHGARPAAIVPVHLYGQMADMPAILDVARSEGLRVIEDCAQAHGARLHGRLAGTWGDAAAFSFYPTKNLGAFGDGGLVATTEKSIADTVRLLRQYGWTEDRVSVRRGRNSRLDELQAAILRVGLRHLDDDNTNRRRTAARYDESCSETLKAPAVVPGAEHVYHQYVVRTPRRDEFRANLASRGIGTAVHYPVPIHLQPSYAGILAGAGTLPTTERVAEEIASLPMFAGLREAEVERVSSAISAWTGPA